MFRVFALTLETAIFPESTLLENKWAQLSPIVLAMSKPGVSDSEHETMAKNCADNEGRDSRQKLNAFAKNAELIELASVLHGELFHISPVGVLIRSYACTELKIT